MRSPFFVLGLTLFLAACGVPDRMTPLVRNEAFDATVTVTEAVAGLPSELRVTTYKKGDVTPMEQHGRLVHLVLASRDYEDVAHVLSPVSVGPGVYGLNHVFTRAGAYRVWVEIDDAAKPQHHDEHADLIAYQDIVVGGTSQPDSPLVRGESTAIDGLTLTVTPAADMLSLSVMDARNNPVTLAYPEGALYALIGQDFDFFRHGHFDTTIDGATARLTNTFPTPGEYVLWIEAFALREDGYVPLTASFLLTVR
jgi:hypothetical protein